MIKKLFLAAVIVMFMAVNVYATATVTKTGQTIMGNKRVTWGYITLSSTYNTGGESVTAANLGLAKVDNVYLLINSGIYSPYYDYTNSKVLLYQPLAASNITASAKDSFFVLDDNSAADQELVKVRPVGMFGLLGVGMPDVGSESFVFARDSSTVLAIVDSAMCEDFGDTIYFDEDGAIYRLYHSGSVTGYKTDYYIPYAGGDRLLRVRYAANSGARGVALYFDHNETEKDQKFTVVSPTNANGRIITENDYVYSASRKSISAQVQSATAISSVIYFFAVGN